jgi:hypothetical protein
MGWTFEYGQTLRGLIAERAETQDWDTGPNHVHDVVLKHCYRGGSFAGTFYAVHERTVTAEDGRLVRWERWLEVTMLRCAKVKDEGASWGYKDASERSGPYTGYSCPLSYLDLVPEPTCPPGCPACAEDRCGNAWARQWRERVRAYHAEKARKRALRVASRAVLVAS